MPEGGRIVATASLAGLTAMPSDPVYAASKHAVVGFVRSVAPALARARDLDQRRLPRHRRHADGHGRPRATRSDAAGFPRPQRGRRRRRRLARPRPRALTGHAWGVQPGRPPIDFRFPNVPGRPHGRGRRRPAAPAAVLAGEPRRTASARRRRSSSGSGGRRPSGAPRPGRRRCGRRGRASPSGRAGSRR